MLADALCRINGDTVSGVNAGALDVLHDTRNQNIGAVADCINLDLLALQIFINQDRMLLCDLVDHTDILFYVLIAYSDSHALTTKYIGRTNQNRITQLICCFLSFLSSKYCLSLWSRNFAFFKNLIKELTVFCCI